MSAQSIKLNTNPRGRPVDESARSERRRHIVAAALRCFSQKGFHATSTAELSAAAEISVAGLYQYFQTKSDLIQAIIDYGLEANLTLIRRLDHFDDFYKGLEHLVQFIAQDDTTLMHCRLHLEITAEAGRVANVAQQALAAEAKLIEAIVPLIRREQSKGRIDPDLNPDLAANVILSFFDGVTQRLTIPANNQEDFVRMAIHMIERAIGPRNHPSPPTL
jgi:TetR/AcrR family transcriptional repressor of uid operon